MARYRTRRSQSAINIWPGFVDALTQLTMVIVFVLLVFTVGQFYLSGAVSDKEQQIKQLTQKLNELADELSLERHSGDDLRLNLSQMSAQLQKATVDKDSLTTKLAEMAAKADDAVAKANEAGQKLSGTEADRDHLALELESLRRDIAALRDMRSQLEAQISQLTAANTQAGNDLTAARDRSKELEARLSTEQERTALAQNQIDAKDIRLSERDETIATLSRNLDALKQELADLAKALDLKDSETKDQRLQISNLGEKLNQALANKVEDLARYRSEFFGRLRQILGDRPDIRVVGDRFVFQSEVLFDPASADLSDAAKQQLAPVVAALKEISGQIPDSLNWILEIDGHTDRRAINSVQFASNWELSTGRAVSVVKFLIDQGIPANRLAASGFGEWQPLDSGNSEESFRRNRRIEIKLTQR